MADELPEKVKAAIEKGPICVAIGEQALGVETYAMFARRIARLAVEESTRSLRERLERAQEVHAYERARMQHMIEAMTKRLADIGSLCQPDAIVLPDGRRLAYVPPPELLRETWEALSLAIREAKDSAHV